MGGNVLELKTIEAGNAIKIRPLMDGNELEKIINLFKF